MSSQSRMIKNFINFIMFALIFIQSIKNSSGNTEEMANLTEISEKTVSSSSTTNSILSSIKNWFNGFSESNDVSESRTFGHIRRLQMALLPILFKFGVMSAMIAVLVFLSLKTVVLLKALLFLNLGALLVKLIGWKYQHQSVQPVVYGYNPQPINSWIPQQHHGWESPHHENKEVHLHIHNDGKTPEIYHPVGWNRNSDIEPYSAYSNRNTKRQIINQDLENYGPVTVSKSYRNVERGNYV